MRAALQASCSDYLVIAVPAELEDLVRRLVERRCKESKVWSARVEIGGESLVVVQGEGRFDPRDLGKLCVLLSRATDRYLVGENPEVAENPSEVNIVCAGDALLQLLGGEEEARRLVFEGVAYGSSDTE